jgi:hypothetical protein
MKIFKYRTHDIGKNYVKSASAFKKLAERSDMYNLDYSINALHEHYYHSTYGQRSYKEKYGKEEPDRKTNAYAYGEFVFNLTTDMIKEDLQRGDMCRAEIMFDYSLPFLLRDFVKNCDVVVGEWFLATKDNINDM